MALRHTDGCVVLVINERGLGNGLLAMPFLYALAQGEEVDAVWHIDCPFMRELRVDLGVPCGLFPSEWVFDPEPYLDRFLRFLRASGVTRIVNLRNEDCGGPHYQSYLALRARARGEGIDVWDADDVPDPLRDQYICTLWAELFAVHGMAPSSRDARELIPSSPCPRRDRPVVGLCLGGSRPDKRVAAAVWVDLAKQLLAEEDADILLLAGLSSEERGLAAQVHRAVGRPGVVFVVDTPTVSDLAGVLETTRLVVSNDTFTMHLAALLGVPTIGLFSTTRRQVWGMADSVRYAGFESQVCAACKVMPRQGTCGLQAGICPSHPNEAFDPSTLSLKAVQMLAASEGRDASASRYV